MDDETKDKIKSKITGLSKKEIMIILLVVLIVLFIALLVTIAFIFIRTRKEYTMGSSSCYYCYAWSSVNDQTHLDYSKKCNPGEVITCKDPNHVCVIRYEWYPGRGFLYKDCALPTNTAKFPFCEYQGGKGWIEYHCKGRKCNKGPNIQQYCQHKNVPENATKMLDCSYQVPLP